MSPLFLKKKAALVALTTALTAVPLVEGQAHYPNTYASSIASGQSVVVAPAIQIAIVLKGDGQGVVVQANNGKLA